MGVTLAFEDPGDIDLSGKEKNNVSGQLIVLPD
jgi:hypothetical protein